MKILKFYTDTCNPCKKLSKIMEAEGLDCIHINALERRDLCSMHNVTSVPTLIKVDEDYKELSRLGGVPTKDELLKFFAGD